MTSQLEGKNGAHDDVDGERRRPRSEAGRRRAKQSGCRARREKVGVDVAFQTLMTGLGVRFYTAVAGGG